MHAMRRWSVRQARMLETGYAALERALLALDPLFRRIGYARLERPAAALERAAKGLLFDCRRCGQCALSSTGMSCPRTCPKSLRNGPCGGVRPGGFCEVEPKMRCVWVEAAEGSRRMRRGNAIAAQLPPLDHRLWGRSSWLAVARGEHARMSAP
ncbi:MAG: methylenetetrahydrofolate reductase C-terminal domain-containing protein [Rhodospirillales bacterium]